MTLLVTGGAGFIGSNFVLDWLDLHQAELMEDWALAQVRSHPAHRKLHPRTPKCCGAVEVWPIDKLMLCMRQNPPLSRSRCLA